jgi:2-polyprenyl-3-methyl-5-hydroxy-6-metoxy-1,4-benzoquinol methylase
MTDAFDADRAGAFAGRLMAMINDGGLCLMTSIGHRTGLFDALRDQPPMTSAELAARAQLNERYVREWIGAMVTGRILEIDPATSRVRLPAEHAACLTRAAGADNLAAPAQYIAALGRVEDDIVECFRRGGGVPYAKFPRFHAIMAEDSTSTVADAVETHVLPLVPGLAAKLAAGIRMLDAGCGTGRTLQRLATLFPNSRFTGMDLSQQAIANARAEAAAAGLTNIEFVVVDLTDFDRTAVPASFDAITTFDAIHDQAWPLNVLKGIHRALTDGGVYLMQDIKGSSHVHQDVDHPLGPFLYSVSCMHCMTVSLA